MIDGATDAIDDSNGDDRVEIFGTPVLIGRCLEAWNDAEHCGRGSDFATGLRQRFDQRLQMGGDCRTVDQQGFGRAADAGPPHLGVDDNLLRHVEIGRAVDIDMAQTLEMGEDRHAGFLLDARNEAFAATRNDHVDRSIEPGKKRTHGGAIGGRHELDRIGRQAGRNEALDQAGMNETRRIGGIGAAAQDDGIAGLKAQSTGIGRHVRPALIDDADDTKRRADALDVEAIGAIPFGDDGSDGILQFSNLAHRLGDGCNAGGIQGQAVDKGGGHTCFCSILEVDRIGGKDVRFCGDKRIRHGQERLILGFGRGDRQGARSRAGAATDIQHQTFDGILVRHGIKHGLHPSGLRLRHPAVRVRSSRGRLDGSLLRVRDSRGSSRFRWICDRRSGALRLRRSPRGHGQSRAPRS